MRALRDLVDELLQAKVKTTLFGGDHRVELGRWLLVERIGAGAMGTVFAAHDPKLDRKVAIKVLRDVDDSSRVLAEARALAKLAHPNVVTVYDAGELDGLVYIVMELAPGAPLRTWIGGSHGWREIVRVMREAGAGIAAAHAGELVHRDIKPDNILVGDDRARVVDFGLAAADVDAAGSRAGTPHYMAPEVLAGAAATGASDQYSFAATAYEALYGERPGPALARHADVPAWLHAVIARGLATEPADRFASMTELVAALGRDRRRARGIMIGASLLAIGGVLGAVAYRGGSAGSPCTDGPARAAAVWNDHAKARVRGALGTAPWTNQTIRLFETHAEHWQTSYRRVCEATRVHGAQSDQLLELRMRCLDRALDRFAALTEALTGAADAATRAAAPTAISELADHCETLTDANQLALPRDAAQRARVATAERTLDRAWAAFVLGRYAAARELMPSALTALDGITAPRVRAEVLALWSSVEARIGEPAHARARLDDALVAAAAANAPELEHDVWSRRLRNELFSGAPDTVIEYASFARAAAKRAGREGAEIDGIVAQALRNTGKLVEARTLLDRALASKDPLRDDQRALLEMNRGSIDLAFADSKAALVWFTRARDRVLSALGDRHPDLAIYEDKLAAAKRARGLMREALKLHDHSIELRRAAFGTEDRAFATALLYRAQTRLEVGELASARADLLLARSVREKAFGESSPRVAEIVVLLGDVAAAGGDPDLAGGYYDSGAELDPRVELAARRFAIGRPVHADTIPPLAPHEVPSVERAATLAVRVALLVAANRTDEARTLAAALRTHYKPDLDAALAAAIGHALLAAGDRAGAADVLGKTVAALGNEPTRTALRVFVGLARASDAQSAAAARAAIALYQAMPLLERAEMDAMWKLARAAPAPP